VAEKREFLEIPPSRNKCEWVWCPSTYFEVLEIQPILGRLFTDEENHEGKNYVAAISARMWRERFAGDKAIIGQKIRINDELYTIVAVMPDVIPEWMESARAGPIEVWSPFAPSNVLSESSRGARGDSALARMNLACRSNKPRQIWRP